MDQENDSALLKKIESEGADSAYVEHLLSTILNSFPDHMYLKDKHSRFLMINKPLLEIFNLKNVEEGIGKTDFDFFSKEHATTAFKDEQKIMETGIGRKNYIEKEVWRDGSTHWVASTKMPFYDKNHKIIGIFGISRDITHRKNIEIELENRARELNCYIKISSIARRKELSAEGYLKKIIDMIPGSLSHANISSVRLIVGSKAYKSSNFCETEFQKVYTIKENKASVGTFVLYFERDINKSPHKLSEETNQVLNLISDRISDILERKWLEKDLRKWEQIMRDVETHQDLYP